MNKQLDEPVMRNNNEPVLYPVVASWDKGIIGLIGGWSITYVCFHSPYFMTCVEIPMTDDTDAWYF